MFLDPSRPIRRCKRRPLTVGLAMAMAMAMATAGAFAATRVVAPSSTGAAISDDFGQHQIYLPAAASGRLFVFLGASAATPDNYSLIGSAAAASGLHSIGLAYPNRTRALSGTVEAACRGKPADCPDRIREEQFTGSPVSDQIDVTPDNSVANRVLQLLLYLDDHYAGEGWSVFLVGRTGVDWTRVRISGLSQGGGLAGYIAKQKVAVDRACFFSAPADWYDADGDGVDDPGDGPAPWIAASGSVTPAASIYGLNHIEDPVVPYAHIQPIWQAFALPGVPTDVDNGVPPYGGSHRLTTDKARPGRAHTSTAADSTTPRKADGTPFYADAWRYACFD